MALTKPFVTIKGTKDGLVFLMDDRCSYEEMISELTDKLKAYNPHLLDGPLTRVSLQLGRRYLTEEKREELKQLIRSQGNLIVNEINSELVHKDEVEKARLKADVKVIRKTVRSGQVIHCPQNMLILGDVNPGACVRSDGDIYVLGALRGMAHAGFSGETEAIIAASVMCPTQLRIGHIVARPLEEWETTEYEREFAYVHDEQIVVNKIQHLAHIRPEMKHVSNTI